MIFKKKKISSTSPTHTFKLRNFATLLASIVVFFLWGLFIHVLQGLQFQVFSFWDVHNQSWLIYQIGERFSWESKKTDEQKIIYILVTWRGWDLHAGWNLTDSILLLWINSTKEIISFLSFPRDLYVDFPESRSHGKINSVYQEFLGLWHDQAISKLKDVVENITGIRPDYSIDVDFNWFVYIIDTLGWVEVTLEENFVDNKYPNNNFWYQTFILRKGTWNLDWEVALMYARSRYSTSDFDRGLRQQQIITGIRKKVSELWYIRDRKKILELYDIIRDNVKTDIPITEMLRIGLSLRSWSSDTITNSNYHDNCIRWSLCEAWWFLYTPFRDDFLWQSVLLPNWAFKWNHAVYDSTRLYADLVFNYPELWLSEQHIEIYNATSRTWYASSLADILLPLWFKVDRLTWLHNLREKTFEKSIIHYNNIDNNNIVLQALKKVLNIEAEANNEFFREGESWVKIILADFETF